MDEKQDGRQAIIEANLSKSQPTTPQSSEESSSTSTAEVMEENEERLVEEKWEDVDSLEEEDFLDGSQFHVKSVTAYDVVRTHAVPVFNGVSNRAAPTAVRMNQVKLVNSISDQWKESTAMETSKSMSVLDLSREIFFSFTGEEPEINVENNTNIKFGAVNLNKPYNGINSQECIDEYIRLIANQRRREPFVVHPVISTKERQLLLLT